MVVERIESDDLSRKPLVGLNKLANPERRGKITLSNAIGIHNEQGIAALVEFLQKEKVTDVDLELVTKAALIGADPSFIFVLRAVHGPLPTNFLSLIRQNWCSSDITQDMFFALSNPDIGRFAKFAGQLNFPQKKNIRTQDLVQLNMLSHILEEQGGLDVGKASASSFPKESTFMYKVNSRPTRISTSSMIIEVEDRGGWFIDKVLHSVPLLEILLDRQEKYGLAETARVIYLRRHELTPQFFIHNRGAICNLKPETILLIRSLAGSAPFESQEALGYINGEMNLVGGSSKLVAALAENDDLFISAAQNSGLENKAGDLIKLGVIENLCKERLA